MLSGNRALFIGHTSNFFFVSLYLPSSVTARGKQEFETYLYCRSFRCAFIYLVDIDVHYLLTYLLTYLLHCTGYSLKSW
jgi:hypothetical protein